MLTGTALVGNEPLFRTKFWNIESLLQNLKVTKELFSRFSTLFFVFSVLFFLINFIRKEKGKLVTSVFKSDKETEEKSFWEGVNYSQSVRQF